jgi:hypothetical protein
MDFHEPESGEFLIRADRLAGLASVWREQWQARTETFTLIFEALRWRTSRNLFNYSYSNLRDFFRCEFGARWSWNRMNNPLGCCGVGFSWPKGPSPRPTTHRDRRKNDRRNSWSIFWGHDTTFVPSSYFSGRCRATILPLTHLLAALTIIFSPLVYHPKCSWTPRCCAVFFVFFLLIMRYFGGSRPWRGARKDHPFFPSSKTRRIQIPLVASFLPIS